MSLSCGWGTLRRRWWSLSSVECYDRTMVQVPCHPSMCTSTYNETEKKSFSYSLMIMIVGLERNLFRKEFLRNLSLTHTQREWGEEWTRLSRVEWFSSMRKNFSVLWRSDWWSRMEFELAYRRWFEAIWLALECLCEILKFCLKSDWEFFHRKKIDLILFKNSMEFFRSNFLSIKKIIN
jgi:hypothetical protein